MSMRVIESTLPRPFKPDASVFSARFWESLARGIFTTTRCGNCQHVNFPPREYCPTCGNSPPEWIEISSRGRLYSRTRIHSAGGDFACLVPYSIAIVDLDAGPRILTRLLPEASELPLDSTVDLVVLRHSDGVLFAAAAAA